MFKLLNIFFIPALMLCIIWGIGWLWFASMIYLTPNQDKSEKTQAIIVLTGGSGRISDGLDLLQAKAAPKLFISGVSEGVTIDDIIEQWETPKATPPCCISLGYKSKDTISNAIEVKEWVSTNKISNFTLVTSSYHMPRAKLEIQTAMPDKEIIFTPVISRTLKNNHWQFIKITFSEYNKYLVRWVNIFSQKERK